MHYEEDRLVMVGKWIGGEGVRIARKDWNEVKRIELTAALINSGRISIVC